MKQSIVAYVPVVHQGYLQFFSKYPHAKTMYLLGEEFIQDYRPLVKDIRALQPEQIKTVLESLELFETVEILETATAPNLSTDEIIMPDEDISHQVAEKFFGGKKVSFDSIFLRWDKKRSLSREQPEPDVVISQNEFDQKIMAVAYQEAEKSSDWWRQVGGVLVKDGEVIAVGRNIHVPHDMQAYSDGDPRASFQSGEHFELSSSVHAESMVIAEAARRGIATEGAWIYSTTFPCPVCAKLIAESGITKIFYEEGYSLLDGQNVLKSKGVEIIKVKPQEE